MSQQISLAEAQKMIGKFLDDRNKILKPEYAGKDILPTCETFDREGFDALLNQGGCSYIRIYLSMDEQQKIKLVIVGANEKEIDQLPATAAKLAGEYSILENGNRCPPTCPPPSPVNPPPGH